ncbi:MAG: AsmA family protein [Thalassobaculum sp.]|uniref:AsmA family protein n=1 Tax=Thalassobaculum sp. TaxID=2022740 RepID=UPI0032EAC1AD
MRWLRWLGVAVAIVVVLAGGAVGYVATLDLNAYKGDVQAALEEASGRRVEIAGALDLSWTPRPNLTLSGVRIANAEWGSEQAMATVGSLAVGVELLPLLTGQARMTSLRLSDVRLLLERGPDGRGNWQLAGAPGGGTSASGGELPEIRKAELERVSLIWKAGPKAAERTYRIDRLTLADSGSAGQLAVALAAVLDGDPVELTGTLPDFAALRRPGAELPVELKGSFAGTPFALAAAFLVERAGTAVDRLRADRLELSFGDLTATGSAGVDLTGARPRVEARLEAGTVDLDRIRNAGGSGDPLDRSLPFDLLTLADGRLELTAARLVAAGVAVDGLTATARLSDGTLTVDPMVGKVAEGPLTGRLVLERKAKGPTALSVTAAASGMDMGTVYRALMGEALIEGRGDAALDLRGAGETPRALLGSSQGVARLVVHEGVILNRYWELIAEDVATRFLPFVSDADRGRLNCLVGRFDIAKGIADASVLMVDSERVTVAGEGTVDLAAQILDMRLVPRPKDPSLFSLATPILLTGPLADPRPAPDPVAVAKGLGGIAASTALGPLGLLLPFLSSGSADQPCPEAIAAAEAKRVPGASKASSEQNKPGGIKGLFDNLRKAIE